MALKMVIFSPSFCSQTSLIEKNKGESTQWMWIFDYWLFPYHQTACETFCVGDDSSISEATSSLSKTDFTWSPGKFRLTPADKEPKITEGTHMTNNKHMIVLLSLYKKWSSSVFPILSDISVMNGSFFLQIIALSKVHNKTVLPCKLIERTQLQSQNSR